MSKAKWGGAEEPKIVYIHFNKIGNDPQGQYCSLAMYFRILAWVCILIYLFVILCQDMSCT